MLVTLLFIAMAACAGISLLIGYGVLLSRFYNPYTSRVARALFDLIAREDTDGAYRAQRAFAHAAVALCVLACVVLVVA